MLTCLPCLLNNAKCGSKAESREQKGAPSEACCPLVKAHCTLPFAGHVELTVLPEAQGTGLPGFSGSSPAQADLVLEDMENTALLANMQQPQSSIQTASYKRQESPLKNVLETVPQPPASANNAGSPISRSPGGVHLPGNLVKQALQGQAEMPLDTRLHAAVGPTGFMQPADLHPGNSASSTEAHALAPPSPMGSGWKDDGSGATAAQDPEHQPLLAACETSTRRDSSSSTSKAGAGGAVKHRWHRDRQVQLTLAGYTSICFVYILFDEMVPMYSSAPHQAGGLGLTPSQLALPLMASGPIMFVWSIWGYPFLEAWLGGITATMRWNLIAAAVLTPLVPIASAVIPAGTTAVLLCLAVTLSFCRMIGNNMFSCASGLINLAAPKAQLGTVNAVGSLLSAGVRSVGPALGGFVWGSSVSIPAHQYAVFSVMSVLMLSILLVYIGVKV